MFCVSPGVLSLSSNHVVWAGVLMEKGVRDAKCFPRSFRVTNGSVTNGPDVIVTKIQLSCR